MPLQKVPKFLEALKLHSKELLRTAENFRDLAEHYAITTFYEQDVHPLTGNLVGLIALPTPERDAGAGENS